MLTEETEQDEFELIKAAYGLFTGQILTAMARRVTFLFIFGRAVVAWIFAILRQDGKK